MAESISNFIRRIEERTGLKISQIPDAESEQVMLEGQIIANSPYGTLVYLDPIGEDGDGVEIFDRCVMVDRSPDLTPANEGADGIFPDDE